MGTGVGKGPWVGGFRSDVVQCSFNVGAFAAVFVILWTASEASAAEIPWKLLDFASRSLACILVI